MVIELLGILQRVAGEPRLVLNVASVNELLDALTVRYGDNFRRELIAPDGTLKTGIAILVNGRNIVFLQGLDTPLHENDKVTIIPPAAGG